MGRVTSLLFGSLLRVALTGVLALGVVGAGLFSVGVLGVPSVVGVDNAFGDVNESTTTIETDLAVHNPNPVGARLGDLSVNYTVEMNDVRMATGTKRGLGLGSGNSTLAFTTAMRNDRIPAWWASHVQNGERTDVRIDVRARSGVLGRAFEAPPVEETVTTDVLSGFNSTETREVNAGQPLVDDPVLYVNRTNATWGEASRDRTPIRVAFVVYNPRATPMPVTELGYNVTMNDVAVGHGYTDRTYVVPPGESRTVELVAVIENDALDEWWVSHLRNDQVSRVVVDFHARLDAGTVGTVRVPLDGVTHTETIETDIFGNADATPSGGDEGDGGDVEGDGDTTENGTATTPATGNGSSDATTATTTTATTDAPSTTTTEDDGGILDGLRATPVARA